jgi:2-keto-3-deoxy-L-rhamnonate aldolase RhmA
MVPMVESAEQARKIVASAKYPPVGRRGTAFGMAHDDFQAGDVRQSMQQANDELLLIAQIETATGLANIEEIAAIEEIDVLWIGHFDLTTSLGIPGEFSHPRYLEAVKKVVETCGATGKVAGFMAGTVETGQELLRQGFRIVAYSRDTALYQQALATGLNTLRSFQRDNLK